MDRNGEPYGELGLVKQQDADWQAQTGAPDDPQPGNISGGTRDVLRGADATTVATSSAGVTNTSDNAGISTDTTGTGTYSTLTSTVDIVLNTTTGDVTFTGEGDVNSPDAVTVTDDSLLSNNSSVADDPINPDSTHLDDMSAQADGSDSSASKALPTDNSGSAGPVIIDSEMTVQAGPGKSSNSKSHKK